MRVEKGGVLEQPMTDTDFQELKQAGLELFQYMEKKGFKIQGNPQELPDHQGIPDLAEEVRRVSYNIAALAKRFRDSGAKIVSWEEYVVAKTDARAVLERIKNLNA